MATVLGLLLLLLAGCAGLPARAPQPADRARVAGPQTTLGQAAQRTGIAAERSGFWGLPQADHALDARLALIQRAEVSIDLQTYQLGRDSIGRTILRALRDAADRGVRVRLLVDDLYTTGLDDLLLGLAAHAHAEVRLFNPFASGRDVTGRLWGFMTDGRRLNHRMHNKLFVADGLFAVAGGRNLADEYFMRDAEANFVDLDFLISGRLVPELSRVFDRYWASDRVWPLRAIVADRLQADQRRAAFAAAVADDAPPPSPPEPDLLGLPSLGVALTLGELHFRPADAQVFADTPDKSFDGTAAEDLADRIAPGTVLAWADQRVKQARSELIVVSPYFLPDLRMRRDIRLAHERGVTTLIVTNGVASSDEPLVSYVSGRYREDVLDAGARLFEINPRPQTRVPFARARHAEASTRLHAKIGVIDRRTILVGSLNLDPRSHRINTEMAIAIDSPELGADVARQFHALFASDVVHEVERPAPGRLHWHLRRSHGDEIQSDEPGLDGWSRFKLWLMSLLVPDELL